MEKIIKIGKQEVKLNNNMAWTLEYKDQFGKDILPVLMPLISTGLESIMEVFAEASGDDGLSASSLAEALQGRVSELLIPLYNADFTELILYVTWAMAKTADDDIEPPKKWIRQFDSFPLDVVVPEVIGMAVKGMISVKNLRRLKKLQKNLQPLQSMISSSQEQNED